MPPRIDLTGQRFGRLVVEGYSHTKNGKTHWVCKCDCGKRVTVISDSLRRGKTRSCGCYRDEVSSEVHKVHGMRQTRMYTIWKDMIKRTENPSEKSFKDYGGRGIKVCEEWRHNFQSFYDWAIKSGYNETLSIDRIDVNGNYGPNNCRWATQKTQCNGKRNNVRVKYNGETLTLQQWSERIGIKYYTLRNRLFVLGWTVEEAFETPVGEHRKKK
jgi:hypothetical protein